MTSKRVSYTMDSTLESVNRAEDIARTQATQAGFDPDTAEQISMSVREATVNAVLHGNQYDPAKKVRLAFETTRDSLIITVSDEGKGLDPAIVPDPTQPENLLKQSGRGIFLIRSFMDEVRFRDLAPGTEMILIKNVRGESASEEASK